MSAAYNIAAPQARPESIISDVSDDGPDTAQQKSSRDYVPSLSSDQSYGYQRRAVSPTDEYSRDANQKYVSPSQASENGDTSLSEVAEAYRNHAMISGGPDRGGRRTPRAYERGEVTSDVIEGLQDEIERLRKLLDQEQSKREELKSQFSRWKDAM
ncbi:hypothetical protein AOL_s00054g105 [Orbilia oligospora ATCC 24927]|uniref:Uncharacterized protein n=1 Tax=Arthrobotrys oligospora (strain ATCC 24927 / CBS 115.81 / DSM 1491) TaxID=756982 RepID=G1X5G1_ARTOA|nr:hypothetical protein AOL_s00054g105 [Orbilia oligospora ATCC 24927]EGX51406.1 hypothetical protein AOL_s00054g105 [Orbilia oligospora ATCC 24927]